MIPEVVLVFFSCHSKKFEPLNGNNNVAHKLNKERKDRRRPQGEILPERQMSTNKLYRLKSADKDQT